ncbi:MAG: hypothetical protein E3K37_06605 [Candidatus Kuenenia sp.]|nr:hypothetical protein [Candidatus Kuenenia hertensis]
MRYLLNIFVIIVAFGFLIKITAAEVQGIQAEWKMFTEKDGIQVYKGVVKGCPVVAFKGIAVIDAPLVKVMTVLCDVERKTEWVHYLAETRIIKEFSSQKRIEYHRTVPPWPVAQREFIFLAEAVPSDDKNTITINLCPAEDSVVPRTKSIVRGELKYGKYVLKSIENGQKTYLTVEILADPKGLIPKWLVNSIQKKWPVNTINGIRRELKSPFFRIDPIVKTIFE